MYRFRCFFFVCLFFLSLVAVLFGGVMLKSQGNTHAKYDSDMCNQETRTETRAFYDLNFLSFYSLQSSSINLP